MNTRLRYFVPQFKKSLLSLHFMCLSIFFINFIDVSFAEVQDSTLSNSTPVKILWIDKIEGDYSFTKEWSFPEGVETKEDGKAGCADGGLCPKRCYDMLDSRGIVKKDSVKIFYEILDTTHLYHNINIDGWCYEWAGTKLMDVKMKGKDTVYGITRKNIATHSSLQFYLTGDSCYASMDLNSISNFRGGHIVFYSEGGYIYIDKNAYKKGILNAQFSFTFTNSTEPKRPIFMYGMIYAKIEK